MDREKLMVTLQKDPSLFWHTFMNLPRNFEDELIFMRVIEEAHASVPSECIKRYQEIVNKAYSLVSYKDLTLSQLDELLKLALSDKRNIYYYINIKSDKHFLFVKKFGDLPKDLGSFVNRLSVDILNNMNTKHFQEFLNALQNKGFSYADAVRLSMQIYHVLGYFKGRDLLDGKYGEISKGKIKNIFGSIELSDVVYDLEKGMPYLNETIINLMLGKNYHVEQTPIKRYLLNDNDDNVTFFIENLNLILNDWDLILDEYTKRSNLEILRLRLNIGEIKAILENIIDTKRVIKRKESFRGRKMKRYEKIPNFEVRDLPLLESDLFDYIGTFNKYVTNPRNAPKRALDLSRMMEEKQTKKFPQISFTEGNYRLFTFHPQDRDIISAGFRTNNCFVPQGQGDAFGDGPSLLSYCTANSYGGGIEIRDKNGKTLAFSPLLRNGNVLMAHSVEGIKLTSEEKKLVMSMLKRWADEVLHISSTNELGQGIIAVVTAEDYYLDKDMFPRIIPEEKKFHIYDPLNEYKDLYSGLHQDNHLLAMRADYKIKDLTYDYEISYDYPYNLGELGMNHHVSEFSSKELEIIKRRNELKEKICEYTDARRLFLKNHQDILAMEMLRKIRELKVQSSLLYQQLFKLNPGLRLDQYKEFSDAQDAIKSIWEKTEFSFDFDIYNISKVYYNDNWFIAIDTMGNLHYECIPGAEYQFITVLNDVKQQLKLGGGR